MHYNQLCLLLCMLVAVGCGKQPSQAEKQQPPAQATAENPQPQKPPPTAPSAPAEDEQPQPAQPANGVSSGDDFGPPMPPQPPTEPARPGVGQLGSEIGEGPLGTPVKALFHVQETLAFMRLRQPMEMYRAIHGHYPKSHEEFFEEIVKKNNIRLPPLPEGTRYLYDAEMAAEMTSYDVNNPPLRVVRE